MHGSRRTQLLLSVVVSTLALAAAQAETPPAPTPSKRIDVPILKPVRPPAPPAPAPAPLTSWTVAHAFEQGIVNEMDVAPSAELRGVPVLAGFRFHYENGDHKFRRVAVIPRGRTATLSFSDQNGDDPFKAVATWALLGSGTTGAVHGDAAGQVEVSLGKPRPNHTLVLSGFEFRRENNTDANVRSIGIWLDSRRAVARVTLVDDQGADFRGFEQALGKSFVTSLIPGALAVEAISIAEAERRLRGAAGPRKFAYSINYAWVPNQLVASEERYTGTSRAPASGRVLAANGVIQGFEFFFGNSDHHLLDFGVLGRLMNPAPPALQTAAGEAIAFQDGDRGDPITWAVQLVNLNASR